MSDLEDVMTKAQRLREAKREWRITRVMAKSGMSREEAEKVIDALNKSTNKYLVIIGRSGLRKDARRSL